MTRAPHPSLPKPRLLPSCANNFTQPPTSDFPASLLLYLVSSPSSFPLVGTFRARFFFLLPPAWMCPSAKGSRSRPKITICTDIDSSGQSRKPTSRLIVTTSNLSFDSDRICPLQHTSQTPAQTYTSPSWPNQSIVTKRWFA